MPPSRTHVLYIAEFSTGGSVESLLCLVGGLDKTEFQATVLFYSMPDDRTCARFESASAAVRSLYPYQSPKGAPKDHRKLGIQSRIRTTFGRRGERFYESLKYIWYFQRFLRPIFKDIRTQLHQIQPDLIHLNNGAGSDTPGIRAAHTHGIPAVCHIRTLGNVSYPSVVAARAVVTFLCISNAVRNRLLEFGIKSDRCIVVPNAVDLDQFDDTDISTADLRSEFDWDDSHKIFALVGRVVSWKGQDFFIRAIAEGRRTDKSIRGLIVGSGEASASNEAYVKGLHSLVSELELDGIVRFTGHRSDVPNIMKSSDAVICASSLPEPFGRVIIESMAVGTPAVATDAGGATDIITDGVDGLLVPIQDAGALAQAMLRLSSDQALVRKLRKAALQTVADHYTVRQHVTQICAIYRTVLDSQQKDPAE
jgi:glycosyltransferase involved in cell wall biosynthesis